MLKYIKIIYHQSIFHLFPSIISCILLASCKIFLCLIILYNITTAPLLVSHRHNLLIVFIDGMFGSQTNSWNWNYCINIIWQCETSKYWTVLVTAIQRVQLGEVFSLVLKTYWGIRESFTAYYFLMYLTIKLSFRIQIIYQKNTF